jgi:hypothetical protein
MPTTTPSTSATTREAGSDATCRKRFTIVSFTRVGSGQPSE